MEANTHEILIINFARRLIRTGGVQCHSCAACVKCQRADTESGLADLVEAQLVNRISWQGNCMGTVT